MFHVKHFYDKPLLQENVSERIDSSRADSDDKDGEHSLNGYFRGVNKSWDK